MNTYNLTCPSCGRDKLSVTTLDDGTVLENCFRASCDYKSCKRPTGISYPVVTHVIPDRGNPYTGEITPLQHQHTDVLNIEAGFQPNHLYISRPMWANEMQRIAFPLLGPTGRRQGWCLRSYTGVTPKALTYMDTGSSRLSYYWTDALSNTVVLVEDIPSAVRAAPYINAVALLGTSLTGDDAIEISANFNDVIIILDNDATRQALLLQKQLSLLFNNVSVVIPRCDLKDMEESELKNFLDPLSE